MKLSDIKDLLMLGAVGFGIYWVYKNFPRLPSGADLSRAYTMITHKAVVPTGQVRLVNGQVIAVADIVKAGGVIDANGNFKWQGQPYTILDLGPDGIYEVM